MTYSPGEGGLNLAKDNGLLERAWVFEVEGVKQNTRQILHGHTGRDVRRDGEEGRGRVHVCIQNKGE